MPGQRKPSLYIPTLYFAEGLPYALVNLMSVVFFKTLGASNQFIGMTSFLYIPWTIKLLWAPLVDLLSTRRRWIWACQFLLAGLGGALALATVTAQTINVDLILLVLIALVSATQDIAIDGYYLDVLSADKQAFYVGIRNTAYKLSWLFGSGGLVYAAGKLGETVGIACGWSIAFGLCALLFLLAGAFHLGYLPHSNQPPLSLSLEGNQLIEVFTTYFQQPRMAVIVFYILSFRLGDALMLKMAQPFLLDNPALGGLGLSTATVGLIYGTVGMIFLLLGGVTGGFLIGQSGLHKWFLPSALIQNLSILLYWMLSLVKPNLLLVAAVNSAEQFAYGLGVAAYTVFLLSTVKNQYRAAHYAIATALMALGVMLPGLASGFLQAWLGYSGFFLLSFAASIPGLVAILFLPVSEHC